MEKEKEKKEEQEAREAKGKSKSEYRAFDFETGTDSKKEFGVQRSASVQNDIEANISNANFGNINF